MQTMPLTNNSIRIGQKYFVTGYRFTSKSIRNKLLTLGLTRGTEFHVTRALGKSQIFEIELRGERIAIHKHAMDALEYMLMQC